MGNGETMDSDNQCTPSDTTEASTMKTVALDPGQWPTDFDLAKALADALATVLIGEHMCLSWWDREEQRESPTHASYCHGTCEVPGWVEYAQNRGAELRVDVGGGAYVYCYKAVGDLLD